MKIKILLIAALFTITLNVQSQGYAFELSSGDYTSISDSISLNNNETWDDPSYNIPIGFDFTYFSGTHDQINLVGLGGSLILGQEVSEESSAPILLPYGVDLIDRGYDFNGGSGTSQSSISYKLEGSVGSQVFIMEWKNVGFYTELSENGSSADFINFQLRLYEGSNNIEIHYGPTSISTPFLAYDFETGPYVALFALVDFYQYSSLAEGVELIGPTSLPSAQFSNQFYGNFLEGDISEGTIYTFSPISTSTEEEKSITSDIEVFPNPANDLIQFSFEQSSDVETISILDVDGTTVQNIHNKSRSADISDLDSGIYLLNVSTKQGNTYKKFVKI